MSQKIKDLAANAILKERNKTKKETSFLNKKESELIASKEKEKLAENSGNAFVNAAQENTALDTVTLNGMPAMSTTFSACLDLFSSIGAMRGKDIIPLFLKAYNENRELALRIALWARDVREGAGERKLFRDIIKYISNKNFEIDDKIVNLINKIPEIGRFDDLECFLYKEGKLRNTASGVITKALEEENGLCAKWLPRQGTIATILRKEYGLTPKEWRKLLVSLTNVVETKMCENEWEKIDYSQVPSVAFSRYTRAFKKHSPENFEKFIKKVESGETKINATSIYPYQIIQSLKIGNSKEAELQWEALPNFIGNQSILPMIDTSRSMEDIVGKPLITARDIAFSLGLYTSSKNKSVFKDLIMTFSKNPYLFKVVGTLQEKYNQILKHSIMENTNIEAAVSLILSTAITNKVSKEDMPKILLIISDMQFDRCAKTNARNSALQMIKEQYVNAGYEFPKIIFWNVNDYGNKPAMKNEENVCLASGFSPALMKDILSSEQFNPYAIMIKTVMKKRYDI